MNYACEVAAFLKSLKRKERAHAKLMIASQTLLKAWEEAHIKYPAYHISAAPSQRQRSKAPGTAITNRIVVHVPSIIRVV